MNEDDLHNLDWLEEFPAVEHSEDPDIRKAVENIEKRKQQILDQQLEDLVDDSD